MTNQLEIINLPVAYLLLALLALAIGSLLNVVVYRLPLMLHSAWQVETTKITGNQINLFFPRSFCPSCKTTIAAKYNIPILSYFLLRGRCKACKQAISWRYPFVEFLSCFLSLFAAFHFGFNLTLVFALLFIWILITLFFIDLDHQLLPDSLTLSLLWLGLIANTLSLFTTLSNAVLSAAAAYLVLWLFIRLFYFFTAKIGMGNGDFKLFAAFGAWFGWTQLPFILLMASLSGAVIGIIYLKIQHKTKETPIPFGPFLCFAGLVSLFWGKPIIEWYLRSWF